MAHALRALRSSSCSSLSWYRASDSAFYCLQVQPLVLPTPSTAPRRTKEPSWHRAARRRRTIARTRLRTYLSRDASCSQSNLQGHSRSAGAPQQFVSGAAGSSDVDCSTPCRGRHGGSSSLMVLQLVQKMVQAQCLLLPHMRAWMAQGYHYHATYYVGCWCHAARPYAVEAATLSGSAWWQRSTAGYPESTTAAPTTEASRWQGQRKGQDGHDATAGFGSAFWGGRRRGPPCRSSAGAQSPQGSLAGGHQDHGRHAANCGCQDPGQGVAQACVDAGELCQRADQAPAAAPSIRAQLGTVRSESGDQVLRAGCREATHHQRVRGEGAAVAGKRQAGTSTCARDRRRAGVAGDGQGGQRRLSDSSVFHRSMERHQAFRLDEGRGGAHRGTQACLARGQIGAENRREGWLAHAEAWLQAVQRPGCRGDIILGATDVGHRRCADDSPCRRTARCTGIQGGTTGDKNRLGPQPRSRGLCGPAAMPVMIWNHSARQLPDFATEWMAQAFPIHLAYAMQGLEAGVQVAEMDLRVRPLFDESDARVARPAIALASGPCMVGFSSQFEPEGGASSHGQFESVEPPRISNCGDQISAMPNEPLATRSDGPEMLYKVGVDCVQTPGPVHSFSPFQTSRRLRGSTDCTQAACQPRRRVRFDFAVQFWFPHRHQLHIPRHGTRVSSAFPTAQVSGAQWSAPPCMEVERVSHQQCRMSPPPASPAKVSGILRHSPGPQTAVLSSTPPYTKVEYDHSLRRDREAISATFSAQAVGAQCLKAVSFSAAPSCPEVEHVLHPCHSLSLPTTSSAQVTGTARPSRGPPKRASAPSCAEVERGYAPCHCPIHGIEMQPALPSAQVSEEQLLQVGPLSAAPSSLEVERVSHMRRRMSLLAASHAQASGSIRHPPGLPAAVVSSVPYTEVEYDYSPRRGREAKLAPPMAQVLGQQCLQASSPSTAPSCPEVECVSHPCHRLSLSAAVSAQVSGTAKHSPGSPAQSSAPPCADFARGSGIEAQPAFPSTQVSDAQFHQVGPISAAPSCLEVERVSLQCHSQNSPILPLCAVAASEEQLHRHADAVAPLATELIKEWNTAVHHFHNRRIRLGAALLPVHCVTTGRHRFKCGSFRAQGFLYCHGS